MPRAFVRLGSIAALLVASACSGPNAPSPATSTTAASAAEAAGMQPQAGTPVSAAASGGIEFLGSDPGPNGDTWVTEEDSGTWLKAFTVRLAVHSNQSMPEGVVMIQLLRDDGQECGVGFINQAIVPGHVYSVSKNLFIWDRLNCGSFPVVTTTVKVTLLQFVRPERVVATFPLRYTIRRYPPPPGGGPDVPPSIVDLRWRGSCPGCDPPLPGDPGAILCIARETDGAALTMTMAVRWDGVAPRHFTHVFPAGAASSETGARYELGQVAPTAHAKLDCLVTNDRGQQASKSVDIGTPR